MPTRHFWSLPPPRAPCPSLPQTPDRSALHSLRELEHQWHKLGTLCPSPEDGWSENDLLAMDMVLASLFSLGTRVGGDSCAGVCVRGVWVGGWVKWG